MKEEDHESYLDLYAKEIEEFDKVEKHCIYEVCTNLKMSRETYNGL